MLAEAFVLHRDLRNSVTIEVNRHQVRVLNDTSAGVVPNSNALIPCTGHGHRDRHRASKKGEFPSWIFAN